MKIFSFAPSNEAMKPHRFNRLSGPFLVLLSLATPVFAETPRMIAHKVQGSVSIQREGETIPVRNEMRFKENDTIITEKDGYVDVIANEHWGVRLSPSSEMNLKQVLHGQTQIKLVQGDFLFNVRTLTKEEEFEVESPTAALVVRGTKFWGRITPKNVLSAGTFAVKEGAIEVTLKELKMPVTLNENQALDLPVSFSFPEVRAVSETEKAALNKAESIPLLLLKANIGDQLAFLKDLEKLKKPESDTAKK